MVPCISGKCKGIHITNLNRTTRSLSEAYNLVFDAASRGKYFLIVDTKDKVADSVASASIRARCHYVNIKWLGGLPDIVIIVDHQEEYTSIRECLTLGIPTICLIDTNCDLDLADIPIPANDDAIASIQLILNKLVLAIREGHYNYLGSH
ncbi:hypothetical protein AMTRI_Chr02g260680 [Amborella trichopoda]